MHPDLQRAVDTLQTATTGLDAAGLTRRPPGRPDKWSAAQIVEHLAKGYAGTVYILRRCLEDDRPKGRPATWLERVSTFVVVGLGCLPSGREAPAVTRPSDQPPADVVAGAVATLGELDDVAARAEARFGPTVDLANHPILGPLNVREWRRFHLVHTRHHAKQIARLRERMRAEAVSRRT